MPGEKAGIAGERLLERMVGTTARTRAVQPESLTLSAVITPWNFPAAMIAPLKFITQ
jgi:acyl-CoA reductase-like NAD-dependent aldehyde dehydrogenase